MHALGAGKSLTPAAVPAKPNSALAASLSFLPTLLMLRGAWRGGGGTSAAAAPAATAAGAAGVLSRRSRCCASRCCVSTAFVAAVTAMTAARVLRLTGPSLFGPSPSTDPALPDLPPSLPPSLAVCACAAGSEVRPAVRPPLPGSCLAARVPAGVVDGGVGVLDLRLAVAVPGGLSTSL